MDRFEKVIDTGAGFVLVAVIFAVIIACVVASTQPRPKRYRLQNGLKQIDVIYNYLGVDDD